MAQPLPYERDYDFQNFQSGHPSTPLPGDKVNAELDQVAATLDAVLARIALLQDDDTALKRGSVGYDQLAVGVSLGFEPPSAWLTATAYIVRDTVFQGAGFYQCLVSHTSGTFSTDLAAGKWELLADFTSATADAEAAQAAAEAAQALAEAARDSATASASSASSNAASASASANSASADAEQTAADRIATAADRVATAADRVQTGLDAVSSAASAAAAAASAASIVIGPGGVQEYSENLAGVAAVSPTDGNFIVGNGTTFTAENGATARTSLGLGSAAVLDAPDNDDLSVSGTSVALRKNVKAFASNSANVTYAQSGAGAVTRAILDYIREREKSVTEYGVDNTGATDVAATLEACLEMGGSWWVPAGDYKITSALEATITSSLYVRCHPDARFFAPGRDGNMINIVVPSDGAGLPATGISFIWDGGVIDQSEQMVATVVPFIATYPPPTGLVGMASSTDGILIRGNYDDGSVKTGIYLAIVRNIRGYAGDHWQSAGGDSCIAFAGCRTMIVENSTFVGSRDQAVYFNNDSTGVLTDSAAIARGNTCINCAGGLAAKRSVRYVSFTENMIDNALTGLSIGHEAGTGTKGGVISNNEIRRCARSILGYLCDSVAIHGNIIKDAGALLEDDTKAVSTYNLYGIILAAATNCTVFGNRGNGVSALWSGALNAFVQLEGYDPGSGTVSSEYNDVLDNTSSGWPRPVQETTSEANYNYIDRNYDVAPSIAARALKTGANPRGLRWEVLAHSATQVSHTGDTNQTTLVTVSIPGRMLGSGGVLRVTSTWTRTSAGTTTFRIRYNGSLILAVAVSGNGVYRDQRDMINRGATNSQVVSSGAMTGGWGTASGSLTTLTVDTTQTYNLDFQVLLSNSADVGALESYIIEYLAA